MAEITFLRARAFRVSGTAHHTLPPWGAGVLSGLLSAGGIPGPIAFGWVIDKACLLWQDQCGRQGSCFVYQNAAMSWYMLIAGLVYKVSGRGLGSPCTGWGSGHSTRTFQQLSPPIPGAEGTTPAASCAELVSFHV